MLNNKVKCIDNWMGMFKKLLLSDNKLLVAINMPYGIQTNALLCVFIECNKCGFIFIVIEQISTKITNMFNMNKTQIHDDNVLSVVFQGNALND